MDISKIDVNLATGEVDEDGLVFYAASSAPFRTYGVFRENGAYCRVPSSVAEATSVNVSSLAKNTAGGRVRFVTSSRRIAIRAVYPKMTRMAHMAFTGIYGFDMYESDKFVKSFVPKVDVESEYKSIHTFNSAKERLITINMPLYNSLTEVYIGIDEGSTIKVAPDYSIEKPIVFYGSSITQGGCASRPGSCYTSIVARKLDADHVNLGFSGSARGEAAIREYISTLDMSAFVLDYDYNARDLEELANTHSPLYRRIRETHPDIPIIIMTRPKTILSEAEEKRRLICLATYEEAKANGDGNVYFVDGRTLLPEDISFEATVDLTHPTDLGFYFMAMRVLPILKEALGK